MVNQSPKLEKFIITCCENIADKFCEAANKIKKDRHDKHILLTLNACKSDKIYEEKESYKNLLSLISIERTLRRGYEFIDPNEIIPPDPNSDEMMKVFEKYFIIYCNVREIGEYS